MEARRIGTEKQPISRVEWVDRDAIGPNTYNPNHQAPPEARLLIVSILANGWTQPIVVHRESMRIVDGEHRWRASADPRLSEMTRGMVPVVFVDGDLDELVMATIRHNRARGQHGVVTMGVLVRDLLDAGHSAEDLGKLLEMESEEVERLTDNAPLPERQGARRAEAFSKAWIPVDRQKTRA